MFIKNWRPISLINVDIKLASKALGFRVRKVLPSLTNYDQTAYLKGRYIRESIRLVDDLLKYAEEENSDGILFAADTEKAFDSVDHNFIFATLNKFAFGTDFIQWIKTLFKNSQSCVMNNGTQLDISILRGVQDRAILYLHICYLGARNLIYSSKSRFLCQGF